jgi:hypothetical protein
MSQTQCMLSDAASDDIEFSGQARHAERVVLLRSSLKVPTGHARHVMLAEGKPKKPSEQTQLVSASCAPSFVPSEGHARHEADEVAPTSGLYVAAGHGLHGTSASGEPKYLRVCTMVNG